MFGTALPKIVTLISPLVVPAQLMLVGPNAAWGPKPAVKPVVQQQTSVATAPKPAPAAPREAFGPRLPVALGAAVIPGPATDAKPAVSAAAPSTSTGIAAVPAGDEIRGLHTTGWVALMPKRMGELLDDMKKGGLNAVMIAAKDESGNVFWKMKTPKMQGPHALSEVIEKCKKMGIKTACRFVCFKDVAAEKNHPEIRFGVTSGDRRLAPWIDPSNPKAVEYVLGLLKECAQLGFDEINLDYVRYPDRIRMPVPLSRKCEVISEFIRKARETVKPFNVRLTASVFGYVAWDEKKANVGQRLEDIYKHLDGIYFMVYPSHFAKGDLGLRDPSAHPYEVVRMGMEAAKRHFVKMPIDILPWIQVFSLKRDYRYGAKEVLLQLRGNADAGIKGYWCWDPGVEYRALKEAMPILAAKGYPAADTSRFEKRKEAPAKQPAPAQQIASAPRQTASTQPLPVAGAAGEAKASAKPAAVKRPETPAAKAAAPAGDDPMYRY